MSVRFGTTLGASIPAALTAVVLCCAAPRTGAPDYFVIKQRGIPVGWLELASPDERRDAEGPFLVTRCRARVRRWADGRGLVEEEMTLVAARRPGEPAYRIAGRWSGGEFRYRAADNWQLRIEDEFGNVVQRRGAERPSFVSFMEAPLPIPTARSAPPRSGPNMKSLELTDGRVYSYRGRGNGRSWSGAGPSGYVRADFGADGAVRTYADAAGLTVAPASGVPRVEGVRHEKPKGLLLPCVVSSGARRGIVALPLEVRLSEPLDPGDLNRPGQSFDGDVSGDALTGTFYLEPSSQPPLDAPPERFGACGPGRFPELLGGEELERMAAWYRAQGKYVRFATGAGLFAGNLLAPYRWLEVEGRAVAAPGRPLPRCRVAFAVSDAPAALDYLALTAEPEAAGPGCRTTAWLPAALKDGAELHYDVYRGGARAGELVAWYSAPPKEIPAVLLDGEIAGLPVGDAAFYAPIEPGRMRVMRGLPPSVGEIFSLGAALAVPAGDDEPPYEFCFPVAASGFARAHWSGARPVVANSERRVCSVYRLEPGPYTAYYTYNGLLARLEWDRYALQLRSYPKAKTGALPAESAVQPAKIPGASEPPTPEGGGA